MNLMKLTKRALIFSAVLLWINLISLHADVYAGMTVEKISESALDELIGAQNNQIVVTFMAAWYGESAVQKFSLSVIPNK